MPFDPFRLESGLLGNEDIEIRDAIFTNRLESYDPTKLELHLTVKPSDGEEQVVYLGCGNGWETNDGGNTAVREDGKETNFNGSTKVGEFFGGLIKLMGEDVACDKEMRSRVADFPLGPRDVRFWKGLNVHIDTATRKGSGDVPDYDVLVIDGFNGAEGGKATKATKATKKAAKAPAKAAGGVTDAIRKQLDDIADASGSHDEFMEAAMAAVPEASTDDAVKAAVADDAAGSIWQDAIDRYNASQG